jgi:hypothetical protein
VSRTGVPPSVLARELRCDGVSLSDPRLALNAGGIGGKTSPLSSCSCFSLIFSASNCQTLQTDHLG